MDPTVLAEKMAITSAAEHQFGVEFTPQLGLGLGKQSREIDQSFQLLTEAWDVVVIEGGRPGLALHHHPKIIAPNGGHQQRSAA